MRQFETTQAYSIARAFYDQLQVLYDLIAEGKQLEALEILYEFNGQNLLHPKTQLHLREKRHARKSG